MRFPISAWAEPRPLLAPPLKGATLIRTSSPYGKTPTPNSPSCSKPRRSTRSCNDQFLASSLDLPLAWRFGVSAIPPEITPYIAGQCIMTTDRRRAFLGSEYEVVTRHTVEQAFVESLVGVVPGVAEAQAV